MKRAHRNAMREQARRQWDYVEGSEAVEALDWHDEWRGKVWTPDAEMLAEMKSHREANPSLPF
jgi:hypothetical protein